MDNFESYIAEALEIVSAWEIEPEAFAQAVNDQARLMAGSDLDPWLAAPVADPGYVLPR